MHSISVIKSDPFCGGNGTCSVVLQKIRYHCLKKESLSESKMVR